MKDIRSPHPNYPRVRVTGAAMEAVGGDVDVNLDGLNDLLRGDLGLQRNVAPRYLLYGRVQIAPVLGLHIPYTRTALVQVPGSERYHTKNDRTGGVLRTLIHESVHLVDSWQHPVRTLGELGLRYAATVGSVAVANLASQQVPSDILETPLNIYLFYKLRLSLYYNHLDPSENRARRLEKDEELYEKYQGLISLPSSATLNEPHLPSFYDWDKENPDGIAAG